MQYSIVSTSRSGMSKGKKKTKKFYLQFENSSEEKFVILILIFFLQAPDCSQRKRSKRQIKSNDSNFDDGQPATIEVYSGLYVNENAEIVEGSDSVFAEKVNKHFDCTKRDRSICEY